MKNLKKTILYISGPGVLIYEAVVLFIHLFTPTDAKTYIVAGLLVFFIIFIPLYFIEYYKQNMMESKNKKATVQFKDRGKRTEWGGGNVHGRTPTEIKRSGRFFNR